MVLTILIIVFIGLVVASFTDMKTREVPDWLNFSLIATGFAVNLFASIIFQTWGYIVNSIAGFLLCLLIALGMFYTGQWGGGDSKMIMAIGALIGLDIFNLNYQSFSLLSFLINVLLTGAFYGIIWSVFLALKNRKKFARESKKIFEKNKVINTILVSLLLVAVFILFITQDLLLRFLAIFVMMVLLFYYVWLYVKIIEKACMYKYVKPTELTEGDWIGNEIKIKGKYICGPKDLGISKKQIKKLLKLYRSKKLNKVLIKEGIPFIPSFLIAFIVTLAYGNVLFILI